MIRPSLSVVHTVPSRRRKLAPALSSPPKQTVLRNQPVGKPLEAHRHLASERPSACTTRSMRLLLTRVLPTAAPTGQSGRCVRR